MYKRIMVALDQSFMAEPVLAAAIALAQATQARLALCHAVDETILAHREVAMLLPNSVGKTEARLRLGAEAFLTRHAETAHAAGIDTDIRVVESERQPTSDMLLEAAQQWQADLLIAGSHGHRGVERFFVGSTAERLVRKAKISLLLVRGEDAPS